MDMNTTMPKFGHLQGVKVLACVSGLAGPFAAGLLAEQGADVIVVENPKAPDFMRLLPTLHWAFALEARNKRSLSIDIFNPEAKPVLEELIQWADVLVENSKPGTWTKKGFSDEALWEVNPKLVISHISGFGQTGDPAMVPLGATDLHAQAYSGYSLNIGNAEPDAPQIVPLDTGAYFTGLFASWGILAALRTAERTGKGDSIDLSLYEPLFRVQRDVVMRGLNEGVEPVRNGNSSNLTPVRPVHKCSDGWVMFGFEQGPKQFEALKMFGIEDFSDIPTTRLITVADKELVEKISDAMDRFCAERTCEEVVQAAAGVGSVATKFMTIQDISESAHYAAREDIIEWYDPNLGKTIRGVAPVPLFKNQPSQIWRGAPKQGMDNEEILTDLEFTAEEIAALYEKKILKKR